jgi:N-sulfoglucosamine sulfohydrolase
VSLLWIVADSVRADVFGCCGGPCATPTVDRLAGQGTLFPRAVSAAPWTLPSLAAMLTGVYPHRLGLAKWEQPWPADRPTLFDLAARGGLEVGSFPFDPQFLFARVPAAGVAGSSQDTTALLAWLRARRNAPYLAFVHYWWTHVPYLMWPMDPRAWRKATDAVLTGLCAGPQEREGVKRLYRHAVERFSETWLPRLLEAVDLDTTWVVLTADHGESWGERPGGAPVRDVFDLHGNDLADDVLRVPILVRPPRGGPGRRGAGLARTVDLAPTLAELLGLGALSPGIDGVSLAACVREGAVAPAPDAVSVRNADFVTRAEAPRTPSELWTGYALTTARERLVWDVERDSFEFSRVDAEPCGNTTFVERPGEPPPGVLVDRLRAEARRAVVGEFGPADLARTAERLKALGYLE